jgi:Tol biopolymer transport system component
MLVSGPVGPQEKQGIWVISVIGVSLHKLRDDADGASISPDNSQIAYVDANTGDLWVMSADGSQAHSIVKHEPGYLLFDPMWFPNGRRILYAKVRPEGAQPTVIFESRKIDGSDPVVLLSDPDATSMTWAQPGRLIVNATEPPPNQAESNLWEIRYDPQSGEPKGALRRLTDWPGFGFYDIRATADAKTLLFLNAHLRSAVLVAELSEGGMAMAEPQRLTFNERYNWPTGWSADRKSVLFYSDVNGSFDIYEQGLNERSADDLVSSRNDEWAPQLGPDGKWIVYMSWPRPTKAERNPAGKLMRTPVSGGPEEFIADVPGHDFAGSPQGGFPNFRCPVHGGDCILAEDDGGKGIAFTAFDPAKGLGARITKFSGAPYYLNWDLSPDGSRIAVSTFGYKTGDIDVIPTKSGRPQKFSVLPWNELGAVAWTADGKGLFLSSGSSRGSSIIRYDLGGQPKLLWKSGWDINQLTASPDGRYLALGPQITDANAWIISKFPAR